MEQQIIDTILLTCEEGALLDDISRALSSTVARRTLQRWLSDLVKQGYVQRQGRGRATRYYSLKKSVIENISYAIPLSKAAAEVRQYICEPIAKRQPIAYQPSFLEGYLPNQTYYLDEAVRGHLTHLAQQPEVTPMATTFTKRILNRLIIDLSWNSSRLEGNTYSLLETQRLLDLGESADNRTIEEKQMILNHKAAISFLVELGDKLTVSPEIILNLHALLANNLLNNPMAIGRLRTTPVGIHKTVYYPLEIPQLIEDYFIILINKARAIISPLEQAFFLMVHLPYLQGFADVNKRVSRLAANIPLIKYNYCPLSFIDVSEQAYIDGILGVYELNNVALLCDIFVWSYERSIARYSSLKEVMGQPDIIQWQYRTLIVDVVRQIVLEVIEPTLATLFIQNILLLQAKSEDRAHLQEIIETELIYLYPGNIARYQLTAADFQAWAQKWRSI